MAGDDCVEAQRWAVEQFEQADLGDRRLQKRLVTVAQRMAMAPSASLPKQQGAWSSTMATYRLLHNERVTSHALQSESVRQTHARCGVHEAVLLLSDLSALKPTSVDVPTRLWQLTFLAATRDGRTLGLVDQRWADDIEVPAGETRRQRRSRWRRSQWWADAAEAIALPSRAIVVADREADDFQMFHACRRAGHGFVIRVQHNRQLVGTDARLLDWLADQPVRGEHRVEVSPQRPLPGGFPGPQRSSRKRRVAKLDVRYASVTLAPPTGDERFTEPLTMGAVSVDERDAPDDVEPLRWVLLTREPVDDVDQALRVVEDYRCRWLTEELHKAQKTGCRLEASQLKDRAAFERLAALTGVVAVRLLQLRDAGDDPTRQHEPAAEVLSEAFDPLWFVIVAALARVEPARLTVRQFYRTLAAKGGHLGRKHDPRPGWQALWYGYQHIATLVTGARLATSPRDETDVYKG